METGGTKIEASSILQLKVRLLGISPMIWRRVMAPEEMSLRELHGVLQAVMGWDGIHLFEFNIRGVGYTSPDLCGEPTSKPFSAFRFRKGAKLRYIYDIGDWWEHEVRIEDRFPAASGKRYPQCTGGAGACPPEDCGGPDGYLERREEATGLDAMHDLDTMVEFVKQALLEGDASVLDDEDERWRIEMAIDRSKSRARFLEGKFSRRAVNKSLRDGEHSRLMDQQIM